MCGTCWVGSWGLVHRGGKSRSSGEMTMQAGCTSAGIDAGDLRWDGQCGAAVGWQADDM